MELERLKSILYALSNFNVKKYKDGEIEIEFDRNQIHEEQNLKLEQQSFEEEKKDLLSALYKDRKNGEQTDI